MKHRKHTLTAAVLAAALLLLTSCAEPDAKQDEGTNDAYQKISAEDGHARMSQGGVTVVDVRRADEYETGHIPGALNIPNEDIGDTKPEALPDLDAGIIVYCRTGVRSKDAADKLIGLGYTDVSDMGGIVDWPYDIVEGSEAGAFTPAETDENAGVLSLFTTTDLEGGEVDQSILEDYDLTMVNVWATFCGPCLSEMPDLGELAAEYKDKGVQIVGLVSDTLASDGTISDEQVQLAQDIVAETGADYPHLLPSEDLYGILSQIYAVPTTFFVDSEGRQVGSAYVQSMSKEKWTKIIDDTLAEVAS